MDLFNVASIWWYWIFIIMFILIDFHFLTKACQHLPTGTVYAVFTAVCTLRTALMDIFLFDEQLTLTKVIFIVILVIGVIGLNLAETIEEKKRLRGVK